jgi:HAD superfamily phosphatase (TIGR01668 family)
LPEAAAWLEQLRLANFRLCLVSNGLSGRIEPFARRFNLPFVSRAMKPLPWGIRRAVEKLAVPPSEVALVGDQLFADVLAGRLAGIRTILVDPINPEEEPWFTRLKRLPERLMLARLAEGER